MHLYFRYRMCEKDVFRCEAGSVQCLEAHFISQVFKGAVCIIDVSEVTCTYKVSPVSGSLTGAEVWTFSTFSCKECRGPLSSNLHASPPRISFSFHFSCFGEYFWSFRQIRPWMCVQSFFSCVWLFAIPWTVARQDPLSMGFSRREYWGGLHVLLQEIFLS